jgi:hypothetical protein
LFFRVRPTLRRTRGAYSLASEMTVVINGLIFMPAPKTKSPAPAGSPKRGRKGVAGFCR